MQRRQSRHIFRFSRSLFATITNTEARLVWPKWLASFNAQADILMSQQWLRKLYTIQHFCRRVLMPGIINDERNSPLRLSLHRAGGSSAGIEQQEMPNTFRITHYISPVSHHWISYLYALLESKGCIAPVEQAFLHVSDSIETFLFS